MAYVITETCETNCDLECLRVCPVDVIHGPIPEAEIRAVAPGQRRERFPGLQLYIHPDDCISCGACESECPVNAVFDEDAVPAGSEDSLARAREFFATRARD